MKTSSNLVLQRVNRMAAMTTVDQVRELAAAVGSDEDEEE